MSRFTPNQERAIAARGNVLVMAGAGTGKTRTLVERCVAWLLDERERGSLEQVLMVTFTEAAAAEMRRRIAGELTRRLTELQAANHPADAARRDHLAGQIALLDTAHIRTLHSFCLELVRRHFHELGLDPQLAVLDEGQARLLAQETLEALLQKHYAGGDAIAAAVQDLIQERARGWDRPVRDLVLKLHHHTQTLRAPARWFAEQIAAFENDRPQSWRVWLEEFFPGWRANWRPRLQEHAEVPNVRDCLIALEKIPGGTPFSEARAALTTVKNAFQAAWPRGTAGPVRDRLEDFFAEAGFLLSLLPGEGSADPLKEDWDWVRPQMLALLRLAREFSEAFTAAKRAQAAADFHDCEQFALRLLLDEETAQPTAAARHWREKIRLICVDEYQDINEAQDAILAALGRAGADANRFLVGDVKQSIYRFRLANPRIFQRYAADWRGGAGQVIPLADNFRSHAAILQFINPLFAGLMRPELGGVTYDAEAALRFGAPAERNTMSRQPDNAPRVELHLRLNGESDSPAEEDAALTDVSQTEKEARLVARRLRELQRRPLPVWDEQSQAHRPVEWKDMVVLLRAPRGKAESYAKEFARLGVPLHAPRRGFYDGAEITDLLSLLRLLDNPLQDLPLLAVLRSPLVGLSLDELAVVRLALPRSRYWTALRRLHATGNQPDMETAKPEVRAAAGSAWPKVDSFLRQFGRWRTRARQGALSHCLEAVLDETHYAEWCRAQPRGEARHANVERLLTLARQFDPLRRQGLFRFLKFVEAQQDAEIETEPATPELENAVRLMSIHQGKGLEFPVVVVADLARPFNFSDTRGDIILDEQFGLCAKVKPPQTGQRYPSLPHWLASRRQRGETLGEELRLLYVALTRAVERLILVGAAASKTVLEKWPRQAATGRPSHELLAANNYLAWLGPWLARATARPDWANQTQGRGHLLDWTTYAENDARLGAAIEELKNDAVASPSPGTGSWLELEEKLSWAYGHADATREPAKTSVSALRRRAEEAEEEARPAPFLNHGSFERGRGAGRLTAAEAGTAQHAFLQAIALAAATDEAALRGEAERLKRAGILSEMEITALDFGALAAFWQSPVGAEIRAHTGLVQRELPFTARLTGADLAALKLRMDGAGLADEFVVVQGVADLAVILPAEIWLLDFKTDRVKPAGLLARAKFYEPQLRLYALALGRIYGRPVRRLWLHFLAARQTVELPAAAPV